MGKMFNHPTGSRLTTGLSSSIKLYNATLVNLHNYVNVKNTAENERHVMLGNSGDNHL